VATPTPLPKPTETFGLRVHLSRIGFGLLPFLVLASPFIAGLASFEIAKIWGSPVPLVWGRKVGFGCLYFFLTVLPVYMLGKALQLSRTKPEAPAASSDQAQEGVGEKKIDDQIVDIWKTSIDVQQHFNDLELRIRNFAVTLLVAIVGAMAFSLKERYVVSIGGISFPLAAAVLCAGIIGWLAFYFMDMHWYHRLLLGSVNHSVAIEKDRAVTMPELGLSRAIGKESPWSLWGRFNIHSSEKITLFYAAGLAVLSILTLMVLIATPSTPQEPPAAPAFAAAPTKSVIDTNVPGSSATAPVPAKPKNDAADASPVNK
jgi:hypothetical protein